MKNLLFIITCSILLFSCSKDEITLDEETNEINSSKVNGFGDFVNLINQSNSDFTISLDDVYSYELFLNGGELVEAIPFSYGEESRYNSKSNFNKFIAKDLEQNFTQLQIFNSKSPDYNFTDAEAADILSSYFHNTGLENLKGIYIAQMDHNSEVVMAKKYGQIELTNNFWSEVNLEKSTIEPNKDWEDCDLEIDWYECPNPWLSDDCVYLGTTCGGTIGGSGTSGGGNDGGPSTDEENCCEKIIWTDHVCIEIEVISEPVITCLYMPFHDNYYPKVMGSYRIGKKKKNCINPKCEDVPADGVLEEVCDQEARTFVNGDSGCASFSNLGADVAFNSSANHFWSIYLDQELGVITGTGYGGVAENYNNSTNQTYTFVSGCFCQ